MFSTQLKPLRLAVPAVACALVALAAEAAHAAEADRPAMVNLKEDVLARQLAAVRAKIQERNPKTRIDSVQYTPVDGLYEVVMGKNLAYMDASGRYALFGNIWDMQASRDLTADRKAVLDRVDTSTLEQAWSVRHVKGKGSRTVYVFADPQCGFCKQLEQTLSSMDDITVRTLVIPILGPESKRLTSAIACAEDPSAAWSAWMLRGVQPPPANPATCDLGRAQAVEKLAKDLGITGTPTLVTADGRKQAGAMTASQLTAWLAEPAIGTTTAGGVAVNTAASPKTTPR